MAVRQPSSLYQNQKVAFESAITAIEGGASSATVGSVTYGASDLPKLYKLRDLASVNAAISQVEDAGQGFAHGDGRSMARANLKELYARRDLLQRQLNSATRGGIGIVLGVPA